MKDLLEISCGLDVHKDKIAACILTGSLGKPTNSEIQEFTPLIPDMIALRDWIVSQNCHRSGFRLSSFISDIFGASGRNIIRHLIEHGQIDRASLDFCLKTKTRNRIDEILMSVNGTLSEHQKAFLKILMDHYDSLKEHLAEIEKNLEADMAPFALQVEQLSNIYGISTTASCAIIAEIGIEMKLFKTAEHICSWAGLCPGNNESAGKRKSCEQKQLSRHIHELEKHGYHVEMQA